MKQGFYRVAEVLFWLGVAAYFGGLLALGAVAAPAVFETVREVKAMSPMLPGADADTQLGGEIFGNVLERFKIVEWVATALIVIGAGAQTGSTAWRGCWGYVRLGLIVGLVAVGCWDWVGNSPAIWRERSAWRVAMAAHAEDTEAHRARFEALHREAEWLGQAKVVLLAGLIGVGAWRGRGGD